MTVEKRIEQLKQLSMEIDKENKMVVFFYTKREDNMDVNMGGNTCIRCLVDELVTYCAMNGIKHTDLDHPTNLVEDIGEIKH